MLQAADEAAELRTRLARTEANLKAVHNEAAEGETALANLNEELQKLQGALAQAAKVGKLGNQHVGAQIRQMSGLGLSA